MAEGAGIIVAAVLFGPVPGLGLRGAVIPGYRRRVMPNLPQGLAAARSVSCAWRRATRSAFARSAASVAHGPHSRSHFPGHEDRVVSCQR
jgi:hypothetical protein